MKYRDLGRTGIKVSPFGLGALMFATRVGNPNPEDSIRIIHKALDAGIDHVDVYQIQRPDPDTDIEETLSALTDLVRSGKIRASGTSTMPASNLVEAHWRPAPPRPRSLPTASDITHRPIPWKLLPWQA